MKYFYIIILFFISFSAYTQSSPFDWRKANSNPSANFFNLQDSVRNYYNTYPNQDTGEGGSQNEFLRWQTFWQNRVGSESQIGNFSPSANSLLNVFQNPICTSSSQFPATWQPLGPFTQASNTTVNTLNCAAGNDQTMGIVTSIAYDPMNNIIYAGTGRSGLWGSSDGGSHWNDLTANTHLPGLGIEGIEIDPNSPNVIYIASGKLNQGYGIGVLKSTNFGSSWSQTGLTYTSSQQKNTFKIIADPHSSLPPNPCTTLYALTENEVKKSTDGGTNWTTLSNATLPPNAVSNYPRRWRDIIMKPGDPNTIYISSEGDNTHDGSAVWMTIDAGNTWTDITPSGVVVDRISLSVCSSVTAESNSVWIYYYPGKVQKYDGTNWLTPISSPIYTNGYWQNAFGVSPTDPNVIYAGGYCLSQTANGGTSWSGGNNGHLDTRCLLVVQGSTIGTGGVNDIVLNGNDGGVSKTTNGGSSWQHINGTGLNITEFYGFGGSELAPNLIIGGTQDNGVFVYDNGSWSNLVNGDASSSVIDVNDPTYAYCQTWNSFPPTRTEVYNNTANATVGCTTTYPLDNNLSTVKPMLMNKNGYLFAGHHDVWKIASTDLRSCNNSGWQNISNINTVVSNSGGYIDPTQRLSAIAIAPSNPNVMYIGYENPTWNWNYTTNPACVCSATHPQACSPMPSFRTTDGGTTWTDITDVGYDNVNGMEGVRWFPISDIIVSSTNPSELWVSFGGFADPNNIWGRVMHSSDGGNTWNDYTNGLTEFPVNSIVYEKGSNDGLYVGTDAGVFYTNKNLYQTQGWVCFNDNLPATIISDLEINYANNKIRAATLGRGIWESDLACPSTNQTFTGTLSGFYEAQHVTITNATMASASNLDIRGADDIVVNTSQGNVVFTPTPGYKAHLFIHGCSHSGNSFRQQNNNNSGGQTTNASASIDKPITQSENFKFTYYPNPFTDHLHIDFLLDKSSPVNVSVYNSQGQLIEELAKGDYEAGEHTLVFSNSSIRFGIYFVRLNIGDKHYTKAVIKNTE